MKEFKQLWERISPRSAYVVDFDPDELIRNAIDALDRKLSVPKLFFKVESGEMERIESKEALEQGKSFVQTGRSDYGHLSRGASSSGVKYDLVGRIVDATGLTRKDAVKILVGIKKETFDQFKTNPEEFIIKASELINEEKATVVVQHITYHVLDERYSADIFTDATLKGKLGHNARKAERHLYDHVLYDSENERAFSEELDKSDSVAVYVKLPRAFYISTPVGRYNPDWAIAFREGTVKHVYFVAETKGSVSSMELRLIEKTKIECARKHFAELSGKDVVYDVVDSYDALLNKVMR